MSENTEAVETIADLKPICFMIMPYGKKPTFSENGPAVINYDVLWDKVLRPHIEDDLGYHAIRADQDLGAMIIKEMIERIAFADLVIADVSTPNANVYYEIGIRHAAKAIGCVLISADWSKQNFDIAQMRQIRFPMPEGEVSDITAEAARKVLKDGVGKMIEGSSPVFECIPDFPGNANINRTTAFKKQVEDLSRYAAEIREIRLMPKDGRQAATDQLIKKYKVIANMMPGVSLEIVYLLRDNAAWNELIAFIDTLPANIKQVPVVVEQRSLAKSKIGNHLQAIASLQELIEKCGETSERRGLIGGRYKKLFVETQDAQYLSKAIAEYDKGMHLDLNDFFPSCNLPRLYRTRKRNGDESKAKAAAAITVAACERARRMNPSDEWIPPTLLAAAFDAGDIETAQNLYDEMSETGIQPFKLDSVIGDLQIAIQLQNDAVIVTALTGLLEQIRQLLK